MACDPPSVVDLELATAQNLITVEGWLSSAEQIQRISLSRSNGFSSTDLVAPIEDAEVIVQSRVGEVFQFSLLDEGVYLSDVAFAGESGQEYRLRVFLSNGEELRSEWEKMQPTTQINGVVIISFEENDPDNPGQQFTVYYPKITARDSAQFTNNYRWIFYKDRTRYTEPETITIQNDRLFDGNFIPNDFPAFGYASGEEIIVELQSISADSYRYLSLLKSQITALGTSVGTTPAIVNGNVSYFSSEISEQVLGYFGTIAVSRDTVIVE